MCDFSIKLHSFIEKLICKGEKQLKFIVFILAVFVIFFFLDKGFRKWLGIKKVKITDASYKKIDKTGRIIIGVVSICSLPFVISKGTSVLQWYFIFYFILLLGFQAILEWKYLKNSKEYIITLILLLLSVILLYNIDFFISFD